jgi:hypothetical protein
MTNNIQYEFNKALYSQGTKGIEVGTSSIQGKYANQVVPNPFSIPNYDTVIGIHTVFIGESGNICGQHTMTFAREIIIQAYKHQMKQKLAVKRYETQKQISNILFEMVLGNPREANGYEFSNAILNYFAMTDYIMRKVKAHEWQSRGFVLTIYQNQKEDDKMMELNYATWEEYNLNIHNTKQN